MKTKENLISFLLGAFLVLVIVLITLTLYPESNKLYKQGQIDALTGKIEYELVVQIDSTRTWERIWDKKR